MKKFLNEIILLLLFVAATIAGWNVLLSRIPTTFSLKRKMIGDFSDTAVIVSGASSEIYGVNPEYLSRPALNLAFQMQEPWYDAQVVDYAVKKLPKVDLVLVPLNPDTLLPPHEAKDLSRPILMRLIFGAYPRKYSFMDYFRFQYYHVYDNDQIFNALLFKEDVNEIGQLTPRGWKINDCPGEGFNDRVGKDISRHLMDLSQAEFAKKTLAVYEKLREKLKSRNIKLEMFTSPVHASYLKSFTAEARSKFVSEVSTFVRKNAIKYVNYLSDRRFGDVDFCDPVHLNEKGSTKFSKILNSDLLN